MNQDYTGEFLLVLYKDFENDPDCLRPTVCRTGIRRVNKASIAFMLKLRVADAVHPHNFAIGIDNRFQLLVLSVMLEYTESQL